MSPLLLSAELLMISQRRRFETVTERTASTGSRARKRGAAGADGVNCGELKLMPTVAGFLPVGCAGSLLLGIREEIKKAPKTQSPGLEKPTLVALLSRRTAYCGHIILLFSNRPSKPQTGTYRFSWVCV